MYYKYDKEKSDKIKKINSEITKTQKQIFDTLLKISKSFSDEKITKKERDESFKEVDRLKAKIKEYNKELKKISVIDNINDINITNDEKAINNLNTKNNSEKKVIKKEIKEEIKKDNNKEIENTINELEDTLKQLEKMKKRNENKPDNISNSTTSSRRKARTQLVVVEEDDSLSNKIKGFFNKLKRIIK